MGRFVALKFMNGFGVKKKRGVMITTDVAKMINTDVVKMIPMGVE